MVSAISLNAILTILVGYIYKSHKLRIMKLNTKSRYAVMALADMARFDGKNPVSLRDISLRQSISLLYLEQIFLRLKKNNIVKSIRGTNGGYIISKNINELKISEIISALDELIPSIIAELGPCLGFLINNLKGFFNNL